MKTNKWIYAILIVSLGWVACDDDDDNFLDKPNLNETDETFVEVAARSNISEIEFGELAAAKASDSLVRVYGQKMVDEHNAAQDELKELADDYGGIEWPDDLDEDHEGIMEQLNNAEGYSFDTLYMATQVKLHEESINLYQTASTNATDMRVKAYASKYLPDLQEHRQQADSIQTVVVSDNATDGTDGTDDNSTD